MTTAHQNIETIRDQLASKIVSYCKERCLHLDGIALSLESGEALDADLCDAIGAYCTVHSLTLGGLLAEVDALAAVYEAQDAQLCSFRNLYRIDSEAGRVVAFVTAVDHTKAEERYSLNGGAEQSIIIKQLTHGYPSDECQIIA